jgi:class 3 adenylate cyclase
MKRAGNLHGAGERLEPLGAAYETAARAPESFDMTSPRSHQTGELLVVDDNRANRLLLGRALEKLGHTVRFAENGRDALEMLRQRAVDLVLLDIEMPEMDGHDVLEALAADPRLHEIPVVMTSSADEMEGVARCLERGAEDYFFTPLNPVLLQARIGASLENKRLRDRQRELFRKLAPAAVAEELLATGVAMDGERVDASVMFSDIRAFTDVIAAASPADTIELLNSYHALMSEAIRGHGGIVNQVYGDGLMAIFGAPLARTDHRDHAVRTALAMLDLLDSFNRDQARRDRVQIRIGIGIASGPVIAGLIGTEPRVTYTCVGDTVKLAAHLEEHTKELGRAILIDEATRNGLGDGLRVESHWPVRFKARREPMRVYSVPPGQRP